MYYAYMMFSCFYLSLFYVLFNILYCKCTKEHRYVSS